MLNNEYFLQTHNIFVSKCFLTEFYIIEPEISFKSFFVFEWQARFH